MDRRHTIVTIDGKVYYADEYVKKGLYKKYQDKERTLQIKSDRKAQKDLEEYMQYTKINRKDL